MSRSTRALLTVLLFLAAWLVPGLGHALIKRWLRGMVFFLSVSALALAGIFLQGHIFAPRGGDFFERLGFLADAAAGAYYLLARFWWKVAPDISRASGDYGTRFFATAGILNLLCMLDVQDILRGRKK